jgi:glycosyltransferase involved in cell wall biosynthesis
MQEFPREAGESSRGAAPAGRPAGRSADPDADQRTDLATIASDAGLTTIRIVAWRDLDDPEAGGSELHAHRVAAQWAAAGLDVTVRTSAVPGAPETVRRDGYRVIRRSGRYAVFPRVAWEGARHGARPGEALVEIWNGMPFLSPLWYRGPRIVFLHHVHAEMWNMVLPGWMARLGSAFEQRGAPPLYRTTRIVTLSESSRDEIVELLRIPFAHVSVAPPGIEPVFSPGTAADRSPTPLVVAVGRLVPVKRFDLLFAALERARRKVPTLRAVVVGEGYERPGLEALRRRMGAEDWIDLPGRVTQEELVGWYRRAWLVASSSLREGWGMTLTEAAACGTAAVATDIAGHRDAVLDGVSGLLTDDSTVQLGDAMAQVLTDGAQRARLSRGALERARWFTWERTARTTLQALATEARRRHG